MTKQYPGCSLADHWQGMCSCDEIAELIHAAVLAERERCAKLAEMNGRKYCPKTYGGLHAEGYRDASDHIAQRIRGNSP